jgi:PAS domain S-box-containing protein
VNVQLLEGQRLGPRGRLENLISSCLEAGRPKVLLITALLIVLTAICDWASGNTVSLGVLYIIPAMLGAVVLRPIETAGVAILCAFLRSCFDTPGSHAEVMLRFLFAWAAYFGSGLFVTALTRNRTLLLHHLATVEREQDLRREAEEQLRVLVESSPAAILTLDESGIVLAANDSASKLFGVASERGLRGVDIGRYLPVLSDALQMHLGAQTFRTAAQCYGYRHSGEVFLANTWFSSYRSPEGTRLAAIVVDSSEEMRDREEQNLRQLHRYNRIAAGAISHEVRNLCAAASLVSVRLGEKHGLAGDEDYQAVLRLLDGMENVAALTLRSQMQSRPLETLHPIALQGVLDCLRIVVEPEWTDIGGEILWPGAHNIPGVLADADGLLQALLNIVKNAHRAVSGCPRKAMKIEVRSSASHVLLRLTDSGPGVVAPEQLFQAFRSANDGAGLGLYISRALLRSYGGDLRFEPASSGTSFVVELQMAE